MTIQQLEYIVALDTYRHFVTAAEKCYVTQPTLTMQVKKLEESIGISIFDRKKSPIEPTVIGESIILKARSVLREVQQLKALVNDEKSQIEGEFRIGVIPTISPYLIPLFATKFAKEYPKTKLIIEELRSEQIIGSLNQDKLDMGILTTPLKEPHLREVVLYSEPFKVFTSPDHFFAEKKQITAKDLVNAEGLWLLQQGHCVRDQVLNLCKQPNKRSLHFESGSIETIKNLILHGGGFTLIPGLATAPNEKNVIDIADPTPAREVSLVVHNGFAKEKLIEILRDQILTVIPSSFMKNEHYFRVKWR